MRKLFFYFNAILLVLSITNTVSAQENNITKVPKQYSIEFGYRYTLPLIDNSDVLRGNSTINGYGFLFDYAWQLSGLNGKKPAVYLSVPIGYSIMLPANTGSNYNSMSMLNYGWTVRHEFGVNKKITPFAGYGLLLNTLKEKNVSGSVMGHQTQFEFGTNFNTKTRLKYFAKIQYSYTSYPRLEDANRIHFQFLELRAGVRY